MEKHKRYKRGNHGFEFFLIRLKTLTAAHISLVFLGNLSASNQQGVIVMEVTKGTYKSPIALRLLPNSANVFREIVSSFQPAPHNTTPTPPHTPTTKTEE